jgi:hypothetical protein
MAVLIGARAAAGVVPFKPDRLGGSAIAFGSYAVAANPTANDNYALCKVPAGVAIIGGKFWSGDLDTNVSPTVDIDVGYLADGPNTGDLDAFGNFGVLNGTAVTNYLPEAGILLPLNGVLVTGPFITTREIIVAATFIANAATFQAGTISVALEYVTV